MLDTHSPYDRVLRVLTNELAEEVKDKELFTSSEFRSMVEDYVDGITGRDWSARVKVQLMHDAKNSMLAATDNNTIWLNTDNALSRRYGDMEARFSMNLGLLFHELGHIMFLDFDAENRLINEACHGKFPGEPPVAADPDEEKALEELKDAMNMPQYREIFKSVYHELANIIADPHDEDKMIDAYSAIIQRGIILAREALQRDETSLEKLIEEEESKLTISYSLLLQMARFGTFLAADPTDVLLHSEYTAVIRRCVRNLENARRTDDPEVKFSNINQIVLALWPCIKEMLDEDESQKQNQDGQSSQNDQSQNGQGNQNQNGQSDPSRGNQPQKNNQPQQGGGGQKPPTPEQVKKILDALKAGAQNAGLSQAPQAPTNQQSSNTAVQTSAAAKTNGTQPQQPHNQPQGTEQGKEAMHNALQQLIMSIAEAQATDQLDKELCAAITTRIKTVDQNSEHKNVPLHVSRNQRVSASDADAYQKELEDVRPYSKMLQRRMMDVLKDLKQGSIAKHKLFGKTLVYSEAYRPDQRYFATKKLPQDLPDMAVAVLVDNSGSMSGARIEAAKKAAVMLYDFCRGLGIPVHVAGHRTASYGESDGVYYNVCADFDAVGPKDGYRITKMSPSGCNRDGMAIEIASNLLAQRPEEVKLLLIISDGQPNHNRYGGEKAREDIRSIVRKYRHRSDIITYAAAIGSDKDMIQAIYGDGFLDIEDLDTLPATLVKLVRKHIIP